MAQLRLETADHEQTRATTDAADEPERRRAWARLRAAGCEPQTASGLARPDYAPRTRRLLARTPASNIGPPLTAC